MDVLTRDSEFINCPHCNHQVRRGMIRCRECNGVISEDFVLSDNVAASVTAVRRCHRCNTPLDPGVTDCPGCASQMLDQLLQAPLPPVESAAPRRFAGPPATVAESKLRPPPSLQRHAARRGGGKPRRPAADRPRPDEEDDEAGTDALYESDTSTRASRGSRTVPDVSRAAAQPPEPAEAAASEACQSLLRALNTTDPGALSSVVTALGQLGDRSAMAPLERLMGNPEIRVRRAVAEALIQLGHPKGNSLVEIAERRVAATPPPPTRSGGYGKPRGAGGGMDWNTLVKPGLALLVAGVIGGGVWWWQSQPVRSSKKSTAAKKAGKKGTAATVKTQPPPAAVPQPGPRNAPNATYDFADP